MQTTEGKLKIIEESFIVLKAYYRNAAKRPNVNYKTSMKIPDFLFEFMLQEKNRLETQCRIEKICGKLGINEAKVKKMMKEYSLKELETAYIRNNKIVIRNKLDYSPDYE